MLEKRQSFLTKNVGKTNNVFTVEDRNHILLSPCTKINSKWVKDLKFRLETLKPLQKTYGKTLQDLGIANSFLNRTSITQKVIATRIDRCLALN
jgi:sugar diacid utilization regulator